MVVYTCPECGSDLQFLVYAVYPPIHAAECPKCGWKHEEREELIRIPYEKNGTPANKVIDNDRLAVSTTDSDICITATGKTAADFEITPICTT